MLWIGNGIAIPLSEIELTYARSSGPGGQNVNKVNSKAVLRWSIERSSLAEPIKLRLLRRLGAKLSRTGELVLSSDRYRDQPRNKEDCLEKLRKLLGQALREPKRRKKTAPSRSSVRRVQVGKKHQSEKKSLRKRPSDRD